jgi:MFS family permease
MRHFPPPANLSRDRGAIAVALAGAAALAVAMGIGRFAFTPILPIMLHDGVISLAAGSGLATANYIGYLAGAMLCMVLPRHWPATALIRGGLVATALLTAAMALPVPALWLPLRFLAGVMSAVALIYTSGWCLHHLAERGRPGLGGLIFAGPGAGIALSGLAASGMVTAGWHNVAAWIVVALLSAVAIVAIWSVFDARLPPAAAIVSPVAPFARRVPERREPMELATFSLAYGMAGFGYIVTATFLPVIARGVLHDSAWLDLFWPAFGIASVAGAVIAARRRLAGDVRRVLVLLYLCQAVGVALSLLLPTVTGFVLGSLLAGLPFTLLTYFAMQEARRLRPRDATRFMGLLTAIYGLGQIAGPPLVGLLVHRAATPDAGFALALELAAGALVAGGALYAALIARWPVSSPPAGR